MGKRNLARAVAADRFGRPLFTDGSQSLVRWSVLERRAV